jgi:prepilin-type processing-associated H-X9-DG protein
MRIYLSKQRNCGLTRLDVLAIVLLAGVFFTLIYSMVPPNRHRAEQINCISNLKQISLPNRIWDGDNRATYRTWEGESGLIRHAWEVAMKTNADTVGLNSGQVAWINVMRPSSNTFSSLKFLQCPADKETPTTTNAAGLNIRMSYFLNLDANEEYPQEILAGDDNLAADNVPVKPGILDLSSNVSVSWAPGRHGRVNNIGLADGSVEGQSSSGLQNAIQYSTNGTPFPADRIAIP